MNASNKSQGLTRRSFIKHTAAKGAAATFVPAYLTSARADENPQRPPSDRINLGCIGVGGRASSVIPGLCRGGFATPVAFADVDFEAARNIGKNLNAFPQAKRYNDFRVMLDEMGNDIDAVVVVTPDHTHFTAAIAAMALGKHVYVEKPLTHTFQESEILMRAEKKFDVVTQMGNQGHTGAGINLFSKMVDAGLCDQVTTIEAWKSPSLWFMKEEERVKLPLKEAAIPDTLSSWDLWCGPRRKLPYNKLYHPFNWRGFYEYGMGMLGDWGAHIIDYAHDKLEMGLPTEIKAVRMDDHNKTYFPLASHLTMHFPARDENRPAIDLTWKDGADFRPEIPPRFLGDQTGDAAVPARAKGAGTLLYGDASDVGILRGHHGDAPELIGPGAAAYREELLSGPSDASGDHFSNFIRSCKGEETTNSPFSTAGKLSQVLALGAIGQYMNTELTFDPTGKQFIGNDDANVLLNPPNRSEWDSFYRLA